MSAENAMKLLVSRGIFEGLLVVNKLMKKIRKPSHNLL